MERPGIRSSDVHVPETERREDLPDEHALSKPGEVFYLKLLLFHTKPRSLIQTRTVDGTVHESFQVAARALGLLDANTEGELCFTESMVSGYSPAQCEGHYCYCQSRRKDHVVYSTTGLAALNHQGGATAHSVYKISVTDGEEAPQCNITKS